MFFIIKQNLSIESPKKVEEKWRTFKHFHNATLKGKEREIGTALWKNRAAEEKDGKGEDYQARCQGNLRRKCNEAPQAA